MKIVLSVFIGVVIGVSAGLLGVKFFPEIQEHAYSVASDQVADLTATVNEKEFQVCRNNFLGEASCADRKLSTRVCDVEIRKVCDRTYEHYTGHKAAREPKSVQVSNNQSEQLDDEEEER